MDTKNEFVELERDTELEFAIYRFSFAHKEEPFVRLCLTEKNYALAWPCAPNFNFTASFPLNFAIRQFGSANKLDESFRSGNEFFLPWTQKPASYRLNSFHFSRALLTIIPNDVGGTIVEHDLLEEETRNKYLALISSLERLKQIAFLRYDFEIEEPHSAGSLEYVFTVTDPYHANSPNCEIGVQLPRTEILKKTAFNLLFKPHILRVTPPEREIFLEKLQKLLACAPRPHLVRQAVS